jgi:hypothetical protein
MLRVRHMVQSDLPGWLANPEVQVRGGVVGWQVGKCWA